MSARSRVLPASVISRSTSAMDSKLKKRRWSRQELRKRLQLLGEILPPLPMSLPEVPASLSSAPSPSAGTKRRSDSSSRGTVSKRLRTGVHGPSPLSDQWTPPADSSSVGATRSTLLQVPHTSSALLAPKLEESENGKLPTNQLASSSQNPAIRELPYVRPKRKYRDRATLESDNELYYARGRALKYSGDARFSSTYPSFHKEYRALQNPPFPDSLYHKHALMIARLEIIDALACFTYSLWTRDILKNTCDYQTWSTFGSYIYWCRQKWSVDRLQAAEQAFVGVINMIHGFIIARQAVHANRDQTVKQLRGLENILKLQVATAVTEAQEALHPDPSKVAHLPSPGTTPGTSRNSCTPPTVGNSSDTPSRNVPPHGTDVVGTKPQFPIPQSYVPKDLLDKPPEDIDPSIMNAMTRVTMPLSASNVYKLRTQADDFALASRLLTDAGASLNLGVLSRHFPKTFRRIAFTTLTPADENTPEFDDDEGELCWPPQCLTGEGLGWVCLLATAMVHEYGQQFGYLGIKGAVPKPDASTGASADGR